MAQELIPLELIHPNPTINSIMARRRRWLLPFPKAQFSPHIWADLHPKGTILRPLAAPFRRPDLIPPQQPAQNDLDLISRQKPARTRMHAVAEVHSHLVRRHILVFVLRILLCAQVSEAETIEGMRVVVVGSVEGGLLGRERELRFVGEVDAGAEGETFAHGDLAVERDCRHDHLWLVSAKKCPGRKDI